MKQKWIALLLSIVMVLGLAACSADQIENALIITDAVLDMMGDDDTAAVGVIGGADGPTSIFVTDGSDTASVIGGADTPTTIPVTDGSNTTAQQPTGYDEPAVEIPAIDEDGTYNSAEDVGLYLYTYGELPDNYITKNEARSMGWEYGSVEDYAGDGAAIGGDKFRNEDGTLPTADGRQYYECDIDTVGETKRGAERIVWSNDGLIYYTADHYESFELLYGPDCQQDHFHADACYSHHDHHKNH